MPVVGQEIITTSQHPPLLESNKHSNKRGTSISLDYHSSIQQMLKVHHLGSRHTAGPDFALTSIWPLPSRGSLSERRQLHKEMAAEPSLQSTVSQPHRRAWDFLSKWCYSEPLVKLPVCQAPPATPSPQASKGGPPGVPSSDSRFPTGADPTWKRDASTFMQVLKLYLYLGPYISINELKHERMIPPGSFLSACL